MASRHHNIYHPATHAVSAIFDRQAFAVAGLTTCITHCMTKCELYELAAVDNFKNKTITDDFPLSAGKMVYKVVKSLHIKCQLDSN